VVIDKLINALIFITILSIQAQAQENCFGDFCNQDKSRQTQCANGTCNLAPSANPPAKNPVGNPTNNSANVDSIPTNDTETCSADGGSCSDGSQVGSQSGSQSRSQDKSGRSAQVGSNAQLGSGCSSRACLDRGSGQCGQGRTPDFISELLDQ